MAKTMLVRTIGGREVTVGEVVLNGDWTELDKLPEGQRGEVAANTSVFETAEGDAPTAPAAPAPPGTGESAGVGNDEATPAETPRARRGR